MMLTGYEDLSFATRGAAVLRMKPSNICLSFTAVLDQDLVPSSF